MKCKYLFWMLLIISACNFKKDGKELEATYLEAKNFNADHTIDNDLDSLLPGVNCIIKTINLKYFVTAQQYNEADTNQLLLVPFRKKNLLGVPSGFSEIENRVVYICPSQIKDFVASNSLSDTAKISGYLGLILLHEAGHFMLNAPGNFDEGVLGAQSSSSKLGELEMGTTPQVMTTYKKLELKVDSLAVEMVKKGNTSKGKDCFSTCTDIQLAIGGAEFMVFGKRMIGNFGSSQINMLKDQALTHPNLELRLAFMNYYLSPNKQKREQIDNYLYEREIAPVNRQLTDPRIFQGNEKILPEDEK